MLYLLIHLLCWFQWHSKEWKWNIYELLWAWDFFLVQPAHRSNKHILRCNNSCNIFWVNYRHYSASSLASAANKWWKTRSIYTNNDYERSAEEKSQTFDFSAILFGKFDKFTRKNRLQRALRNYFHPSADHSKLVIFISILLVQFNGQCTHANALRSWINDHMIIIIIISSK